MAASSDGLRLGARLQAGRERAGLTVIQAAERLHVDPYVIEALEAERFEELGASVYVRGHIRHYAELVGEPPAELLGLYATSEHAARTPDLTRVPKGEDSAEVSRALLVPAVLFVLAVAIIGTAWWVEGTLSATSHSPRRGPAQAPQRAARAQAAATPAAAIPSSSGPPEGAQPIALHAAASPRGGAPTPSAAPLAGTGGAAAASPRTPAAHRTEPQHVRTSALRMHFAQDSWTEVYDARGSRLFYDIGFADSTRTVSGTPPLRVVLGNPAAVALELDGRPVSIPDGAERNVPIDFRITRSGRAAPSHLAAVGGHPAATAGRDAAAGGAQAP